MAAVCCAWTSRLAMVWRKRLIGTRFSIRSPCDTGAAAACLVAPGAALFFAVPACTARCTSSLRTRPPLPVPSILLTSRSCSATSLRAAGARILSPTFSSLAPSSADAAGTLSAAVAATPSAKIASTASDSTWLPSSALISVSAPSAGATTSSTTLSVSISTSTSSRWTASPTCLCQVATLPSWIDSGKVGAFTWRVSPVATVPPAAASAALLSLACGLPLSLACGWPLSLACGWPLWASPAPIRPSTCSDCTVSPSSTNTSCKVPASSATTSSTTLSVSISTISSSRSTRSPGFLCQAATLPSATDSGKVGVLISVAISFPLCSLSSWHDALQVEGVFYQLALLFGMHGHITRRGCCRCRATGKLVLPPQSWLEHFSHCPHVMLARVPGTLVQRLFLTPHQGLKVYVILERLVQLLLGEGIELLNAHDGYVVYLVLCAPGDEIIVNLAGTHDNAPDLLRFKPGLIRQHHLEMAIGEVFQAGNGLLVTQQALGRHHHQRLA